MQSCVMVKYKFVWEVPESRDQCWLFSPNVIHYYIQFTVIIFRTNKFLTKCVGLHGRYQNRETNTAYFLKF